MEPLASMVRQRRGALSLREAAEASGVSHSTLCRVEAGEMPDLETFTALCRWLGVSADLLLFGQEMSRSVDLAALLAENAQLKEWRRRVALVAGEGGSDAAA